MRSQRVEVSCDECGNEWGRVARKLGQNPPSGQPAVVTCETHHVDLCQYHLVRHFVRESCVLVPAGQPENTGGKER
jgi:hypothetical protein